MLPEELSVLDEKDVFIGPTASGKHRKYQAMKDHSQMREQDILDVNTNGEAKKAIQWGFQSRNAVQGFQTMCRGKVWIHKLGVY